MFHKIKNWYNGQSQTTKAFIWVAVLLIIGIVLRWNHIIDNIISGFNFFKQQ
jgi:hypothetical protein